MTSLFQVCYEIDDFSIKERETKALVNASEKLQCRNLEIITWDFESETNVKKKTIRFIPLWKWLLGNKI